MDRYDVIFMLGLVLVAAGLWFGWWPLALMVPGGILLVVGLAGAVFGGSRG